MQPQQGKKQERTDNIRRGRARVRRGTDSRSDIGLKWPGSRGAARSRRGWLLQPSQISERASTAACGASGLPRAWDPALAALGLAPCDVWPQWLGRAEKACGMPSCKAAGRGCTDQAGTQGLTSPSVAPRQPAAAARPQIPLAQAPRCCARPAASRAPCGAF